MDFGTLLQLSDGVVAYKHSHHKPQFPDLLCGLQKWPPWPTTPNTHSSHHHIDQAHVDLNLHTQRPTIYMYIYTLQTHHRCEVLLRLEFSPDIPNLDMFVELDLDSYFVSCSQFLLVYLSLFAHLTLSLLVFLTTSLPSVLIFLASKNKALSPAHAALSAT